MNAPAKLHEVTLDDKYTLDSGRVFLTGTQALVMLVVMAALGLIPLFWLG